MRFGVITIDDSRAVYKNRIRSVMSDCEEIEIDCVDARPVDFDLDGVVRSHGLEFSSIWPTWKKGEIGGWLSHFNSWRAVAAQEEPVVIFEDDAILPDNFYGTVTDFIKEVPEDYDFVALCVPENQKPDYMWVNDYNEYGEPNIIGRCASEQLSQHYIGEGRVAKAYPGYGHTAMLFSPTGAEKLVALANRFGFITPADCFILNMSHNGELKGYAPKPEYTEGFAVFNDGETSIIQTM